MSAIAALVGVSAIFFAIRQLHFDAWLKAQEIWVSSEFTAGRSKVFAHLDNLQQQWPQTDKEVGLEVCRRIDEFARLAPYLGERRMLSVWGDTLAKAWLVLAPLVSEERLKTDWKTKWDAFEKLGAKALRARPDLQAKQPKEGQAA